MDSLLKEDCQPVSIPAFFPPCNFWNQNVFFFFFFFFFSALLTAFFPRPPQRFPAQFFSSTRCDNIAPLRRSPARVTCIGLPSLSFFTLYIQSSLCMVDPISVALSPPISLSTPRTPVRSKRLPLTPLDTSLASPSPPAKKSSSLGPRYTGTGAFWPRIF